MINQLLDLEEIILSPKFIKNFKIERNNLKSADVEVVVSCLSKGYKAKNKVNDPASVEEIENYLIDNLRAVETALVIESQLLNLYLTGFFLYLTKGDIFKISPNWTLKEGLEEIKMPNYFKTRDLESLFNKVKDLERKIEKKEDEYKPFRIVFCILGVYNLYLFNHDLFAGVAGLFFLLFLITSLKKLTNFKMFI